MAYFVYILHSRKNGTFYKGQTDNIERRLMEHNCGKVISTSRYIPWEIAWCCQKESRSEAMKLERKLKNITSKKRLEDFIKKNSAENIVHKSTVDVA